MALERSGKVDRAINAYKEALRLAPDSVRFCNSLAGLSAVQGDFDQAVLYYRRSNNIKPDQPVVLNNLAWFQATRPSLSSRDVDEAVELARRLCSLTDFKHPNALDTLAVAYAAAGDFSKATETARKAQELAEASGNAQLAQGIAEHLKLFSEERSYIESVPVGD